nr:MAG TPA: adenine-specific methyltransferase [Caudoviricetes sp.]
MLGINNENCFDTIRKMREKNRKVGLILTSPPYNTGRNSNSERGRNNHEARYDIHLDNMTDSEYLEWTKYLFHGFDSILKTNGVVLYNMSYGTDIVNTKEDYKPNEIMYKVINKILEDTPFTIADTIVWKKSSALPNNTSKNKLTRICEFVYVFVRKSELKTFNTNKRVKSVSSRGQSYYENVFNLIEARNNDGSNNLNKATFSSELVLKLLDIYYTGGVVYDPFLGTGTTGLACEMLGIKWLGSEISEAQCEYAKGRIEEVKNGSSSN